MPPCELTRALLSLRLQGWFSGLNGILIGRSAAPEQSDATQLQYLDALRSALGDLQLPILYEMDIGHVPPQLSLVNGATAKVIFNGSESAIQQQL